MLAGACLDEEETLIPKLLASSQRQGDVRYTKEARPVDGRAEQETVVEFDVEETPMTSDIAKSR